VVVDHATLNTPTAHGQNKYINTQSSFNRPSPLMFTMSPPSIPGAACRRKAGRRRRQCARQAREKGSKKCKQQVAVSAKETVMRARYAAAR